MYVKLSFYVKNRGILVELVYIDPDVGIMQQSCQSNYVDSKAHF